jgi:hypothetical protein
MKQQYNELKRGATFDPIADSLALQKKTDDKEETKEGSMAEMLRKR